MTSSTSVERRRVVARRTLLAATTILAAGIILPAAAQLTPPAPVHQSVDANGVDLFAGTFNVAGPAISMGQGDPQGLSYFFMNSGSGWGDNIIAALNSNGSTATVRLGSSTDDFSVSGTTYTSKEGNGATLVLSNGLYVYTSRDGTVVRFSTDNAGPTPYYANLGRAVSMTRPSGATLSYDYETPATCIDQQDPSPHFCDEPSSYQRLASVTSSYGYVLAFSYQTSLLDQTGGSEPSNLAAWSTITGVTLTNQQNANSVELTESTGLSGSTFSITDAMGRVTRYRMSGNQVAGITRPGSSSENVTIAYSGGRVASVATVAGTWTYSNLDHDGVRTVTVTDPASQSTSYVFDLTTTLMKRMTNALNQTSSWTYDSSNRLTVATAPENNFVTYNYDDRGNVTSTVLTAKNGVNTLSISANYDAICSNAVTCNQPHYTIDANLNRTDYTYDPVHGGVTLVTSPMPSGGAVQPATRYTYTGYTDQLGGTVYRQTGSSTCRTQAACSGTADEVVTSVNYGSLSNNLLPLSASRGAGDGSLTATNSVSYDSVGNAVLTTDPTGAQTRYIYDADRELTELVSADPDGSGPLKPRAVRTTYNADGTVSEMEVGTDTGSNFASLQQVTTSYDGALRQTRKVATASGTTYGVFDYGYDPANRITCATQRMNPAAFSSQPGGCALGAQGSNGPDRMTRTHYDQVGRPDSVTSAYGTGDQAIDASFSYSLNGKTNSATDAKGNVTQYSYDGFDRLVRTNYPNPSGSGANAADYELLTLDGNGNVLTRRLRDGTSIGFTIDALNRTTAVSLPGGNNAANSSFAYDNLGELTGASNANGAFATQTSFTWDALGRKTAETNAHGGTSKTEHMQYDLAGRRTLQTWDDAFFVRYDHDALGETTSIHNDADTFVTLAYDDLGRRTTLNRGNGTSTGYSYDAASQLTTLANALPGTGKDLTLQFGYNSAGQIVSRTSSNDAYAFNGAFNATKSYTTNGLNQYSQVAGATFGYDARGNTISTGGASFSYDPLNQLTGAGSTRLDYDALGRLVYDTNSGIWQEHDGAEVTTEYDGSGNVLRRYVFGPGIDEPLLWFEGTGTSDRRYLHADERGSVVAVSGSGGNALAVNAYDEHGTPAPGNVGQFQYTGQRWVPSLGLYDYKARMYAPSIGRFMQTDPIGYADGLNWYSYAGGDPVNNVDPSGRSVRCTDGSSIANDVQSVGDPCADSGHGLVAEINAGYDGGGGGSGSIYVPFGVPFNSSPIFPANEGEGSVFPGRPAPAQKPQCNQTLINIGNKLASLADSTSQVAGMIEGTATIGTIAAAVTGQEELVPLGFAAMRTGAMMGNVAGALQVGAGLFQGFGGAGFSNAYNGAGALAGGYAVGSAFKTPSGYRTVSQRAADGFFSKVGSFSGAAYDAITSAVPGLGAQQKSCP